MARDATVQDVCTCAQPESTWPLPPFSSVDVMGVAACGQRNISVCRRLDADGPGWVDRSQRTPLMRPFGMDVPLACGVRHARPRSPVLVTDTLLARRKDAVKRTKQTWRCLMSGL